jgi:hypothetical protein
MPTARLPGAEFRAGLKRVGKQVNVEIVKRSAAGKFVVLPKRWNRRTHNRLVEPLPAAGQGLEMPKP